MSKYRQTGSIYSPIKNRQNTSALRQININTQRTLYQGNFQKLKQSTDASKTTSKWAYQYDNIQSSKTQQKSSIKSYQFQSFKNSLNSSKVDAMTQLCCPYEMNNSIRTQSNNQQSEIIQDSLAQYQNIYEQFVTQTTMKSDCIVKKLTCLNNIFKQIKQFKKLKISGQINYNLSIVEDSLLAIERQIIKSQTLREQRNQQQSKYRNMRNDN